ncbi:MAG: hypothetical protein PUB51_00140 [Oscillospiraceae bacterium]|nr:hypothetical protein [Oscillospiraceae bacterium]
MTTKELNQLSGLRREAGALERRLKELEKVALLGPNGPVAEEYAGEVKTLREMLEGRRLGCIRERVRLEKWIGEIPDSMLRQIFSLRYIESKTWAQVARGVGGGNTQDGVRKAHDRYMASIS